MGFYNKENIAHGTTLGIWKKEEPLDLLESVYILNDHEAKEYAIIKNETRKKEWLITRILLAELLEKRLTIYYNKHRKPYLENHNSNLTITHSRNFVAIIISSTYFPGIDIEHISQRVEKVKHKFLNTEELEWCISQEQMTACWGAKEAIFKIYQKELDFHDMVIAPFQIDSNVGQFKASVISEGKEGSYSVNFKRIEDDILTYTLSKSPLG